MSPTRAADVNPPGDHARTRRAAHIVTLVLLALFAALRPAAAQGIRDAEIEAFINQIATPVFEAAGLDPAATRIFIINRPGFNAFVAGGQNIFVHTGLLMEAETPNEVVGVLAHESGHISGGHLGRTRAALQNSTAPIIAGLILGAAAAVAGAPAAGIALAAGGRQVAERDFFTYTRVQESAADQAGLDVLDRIGESGQGMVDVLRRFADQDALSPTAQDPYARTHPVSRERLSLIENRVATSAYPRAEDSPARVMAFRRMQAKLHGFLDDPALTLRRYPPSDISVPASYARAVAYHRSARLPEALAEIERLLAAAPGDPYYLELEGQILFEQGRIPASIPPLRKALAAAPDAPLIRLALGRALLALDDAASLPEALAVLERAAKEEPRYPFVWHQLAIAYARSGNEPMAQLATAERLTLNGRDDDARRQAEQASRGLPTGSPAWIRARDLVETSKKE